MFELVRYASFSSVFIVVLAILAYQDARDGYLIDILTIPLLLAGLTANAIGFFTSFGAAAIGACVGYVFLRIVAGVSRRITGRDCIGGGDCKLFAAIGAWLGWLALPEVMLIGASLTVAGGLLFFRRGAQIPFGPGLAAGAMIVLFVHG